MLIHDATCLPAQASLCAICTRFSHLNRATATPSMLSHARGARPFHRLCARTCNLVRPHSVTPHSMATSVAEREQYDFGPYPISANEVFAKTALSYAFVNLKPIVPGHVLISPIRVVRRFADLTANEVADLWGLAQLVGKTLEPHYKADSLTLAIQDGPAAGQTVPHVHIHILPRRPGDFKRNDDVYDELDKGEAKLSEKLDLDKDRVVRTRDEMAAEAAELRKLFISS